MGEAVVDAVVVLGADSWICLAVFGRIWLCQLVLFCDMYVCVEWCIVMCMLRDAQAVQVKGE